MSQMKVLEQEDTLTSKYVVYCPETHSFFAGEEGMGGKGEWAHEFRFAEAYEQRESAEEVAQDASYGGYALIVLQIVSEHPSH